MVSSVFFQTGEIAYGMREVMNKCRSVGAELLVDAYHSLNVVPFYLKRDGLQDAFIVGGGYKYCQLGKGTAFFVSRVTAACARWLRVGSANSIRWRMAEPDRCPMVEVPRVLPDRPMIPPAITGRPRYFPFLRKRD